MVIYTTITTLARHKWISPRKAKALIGSKIFMVQLQKKIGKESDVWYIYIDDMIIFMLNRMKKILD